MEKINMPAGCSTFVFRRCLNYILLCAMLCFFQHITSTGPHAFSLNIAILNQCFLLASHSLTSFTLKPDWSIPGGPHWTCTRRFVRKTVSVYLIISTMFFILFILSLPNVTPLQPQFHNLQCRPIILFKLLKMDFYAYLLAQNFYLWKLRWNDVFLFYFKYLLAKKEAFISQILENNWELKTVRLA